MPLWYTLFWHYIWEQNGSWIHYYNQLSSLRRCWWNASIETSVSSASSSQLVVGGWGSIWLEQTPSSSMTQTGTPPWTPRPRTAAIALDRQETYTSIGGYCCKANKSGKVHKVNYNHVCWNVCLQILSYMCCNLHVAICVLYMRKWASLLKRDTWEIHNNCWQAQLLMLLFYLVHCSVMYSYTRIQMVIT